MATDTFYIIDDLLKILYVTEVTMPFTITSDDGLHTVQLMDTGELLAEMSLRFGSYRFYPPAFITGNIPSYYKETWENFLARNNHNIWRQYDALGKEYNPINNYDLTEQAADGSRIAKNTTTATPSGTMQVTSAHTGTDTTTDKKYGFDSAAAIPADVSDFSHGETITDTTSFTGYKTVTDTVSENNQSMQLPDGTTGSGYDNASEHYLRRFGNIGVQTAADIIGGELAVRVHDLAAEWLMRFCNDYFVFVG